MGFETNAIEIRLAQTEINGLYKIGSMLEHSCVPNVSLTFDDKFKMSVKAGRDIQKGAHLNDAKKFWCQCRRCSDSTEFGTEFSTLLREGKQLRPENPLNQEAGWVSKDGSVKVPSYQVAEEMQEIGAELAILQLKGTIEDYEEFIENTARF